MNEWYEDERFWVDFYPIMFPEQGFAAAAEQVDAILSQLESAPVEVLDLCCGPGRHSIPLARRGMCVTAVDRTPFLIGEARRRADVEKLAIEFVESDMRDFRREAAFDLALNMFTSFGYFDNDADNFKVLENVAHSLKPEGVFVIDVLGKEVLARIFEQTRSHRLEDGALIVQRTELFDDWSRVQNEWIVLRDGESRNYALSHFIYSGRELKQLLLAAGFESVQLYGDFSGAAYDEHAQRLVAFAKKGR